MDIALWVLQVLLGTFFVFHTTVLLRPSLPRLQSGMQYILEMPPAFASLRQSHRAWLEWPSSFRRWCMS